MKTLLETLRATHWHKAEIDAWETISNAIPAVIETNLKLWQRRIESKGNVAHTPHKSLFAIDATHYAKRADGVFAPDGETLAFLCAADSVVEARAIVTAQLTAHGLNPQEWALGSTCTPMILV